MDPIERSASDDRGCGVPLAGRDERQARLVISRGQVCRTRFRGGLAGLLTLRWTLGVDGDRDGVQVAL
jgi:hypothetical protein